MNLVSPNGSCIDVLPHELTLTRPDGHLSHPMGEGPRVYGRLFAGAISTQAALVFSKSFFNFGYCVA